MHEITSREKGSHRFEGERRGYVEGFGRRKRKKEM